MATPLILKKITVQIQTALGSAKTITGISKVSEAVVTATHDFSIGDLIVISGVVGMTEINDKVVRVKSVSTTVSFVAEGLDSSAYTTYVSGGTATKVTTMSSFDNVTNLSLPDSPPTEIDATTIHDLEKQVVFGLRDYPKGTLALIADPLATTSLELKTAEAANTRRVFKVVMQNGYVAIFNAYVSGGSGMDGSSGGIATANVSLTLRNAPQWFAS